MSYSDAEMVIASQIAYYDFDPDVASRGCYTVREMLELDCRCGDQSRQDAAAALLSKIDNSKTNTSGCGDWVIKDVRNNNDTSGMYGVMLETGDREAMIAFRGSEDPANSHHLATDWIVNDAGLLNSTMTPQQRDAQLYMEELNRKYGNDYDSYGVTGHSLGGNLAQSATVTAPDAMQDKITQCVSLDGPGFSNEYIAAHSVDISKVSGKMTHLQWSIVGSLLLQLPGTTNRIVSANTPTTKLNDPNTEEKSAIVRLLNRHDMVNLIYGEDGRVEDGTPDALAIVVGPESKYIDMFTSFDVLHFLLFPVAITIESVNGIVEYIKSLFKRNQEAAARREEARRCNFEFDPLRTAQAIENLNGIANQLGGIMQSIEEIRSSVSWQQLLLRYQLDQNIRTIKKQRQNTEKMVRCGNNCLEHYVTVERSLC